MKKCDGRCGVYNTRLPCIYMIMQISTGAKYIGQTVDFWQRREQYRRYGEGRSITDAIIKNGWNDFIMLPIEIFDFNKDILIFNDNFDELRTNEKMMNEREQYWINYYDTENDTFHFNVKKTTDLITCVEDKCIYHHNCNYKYWNEHRNEYHCWRGQYTSS